MESPSLIQLTGSQPNRQIPLEPGEFSIGRTRQNSVFFPEDKSLSRKHARIFRHLGLIWLEDQGSTNGTFIKYPEGEEHRLKPLQPILLTEECEIRVGAKLRFKIVGTISSSNQAMHMLQQRLQEFILDMHMRMPSLSPEEQQHYRSALEDFEIRLAASQDEEQLALLVAEEIDSLSQNLMRTNFFNHSALPPELPELPPIASDLPEPGMPNRFETLRNVFISDIRICFPEDDENDPSQ